MGTGAVMFCHSHHSQLWALKDYCTEKLCSVVWIPNTHLLQIWKNCLQLANLWRMSSVVCIDSPQLHIGKKCPNIHAKRYQLETTLFYVGPERKQLTKLVVTCLFSDICIANVSGTYYKGIVVILFWARIILFFMCSTLKIIIPYFVSFWA